jgi:hypothetical protein
MASYAQAAPSDSGVDALSLANMIVSSAGNATTHRKNCEQLAEHVRLIGNLLEKLRSTDLMNLPETKEPLDGLEEALREALELVESCKEKSCLYMLAKGWNAVYQFRQLQTEIDRHLRLVPLISLAHKFRMQVHLTKIFSHCNPFPVWVMFGRSRISGFHPEILLCNGILVNIVITNMSL